MKYVQVNYTILKTFEVNDDITPDEVEELIEDDMWDKGIVNYVNKYEWDFSD